MNKRTRGRPTRITPGVNKTLVLDQLLVEQVEKILYDPIQERVPYNAFATLVEGLLKKWMDENGERLLAVKKETELMLGVSNDNG